MAGIYIHIPFCRQACTYCNFHFSTLAGQKTAVLEAIKQEISLTPLMVEDELIATIYLGGGTPSLLLPEEISSIFESLQENFTISPAAEITLEANPDDISTAILQQWKAMNINRISLGVQSFNEAELKWMNRAHNAGQSIESINNIRNIFTHITADIIFTAE